MLPDTDRLKFDLYQHEIICADVFTAYLGKFSHWGVPTSETLTRLQLKPDRYMKLYDVELFLEIDRGTESAGILAGKMDKYRQYSQILRRRFHVVFVVQDYRKDVELKAIKDSAQREAGRFEKQRKRGELIRELAMEARCGNLFLFTCQDWIMRHPEEPILGNPLGSALSFEMLPDLYDK